MSNLNVKIFGPAGVEQVNVKKSHLTIGSGSHCDIRLVGEGIEDEHFRIWSDGEHLWGQAVGSDSMTYMNGQSLQLLRPLLFREMDLFRVGESGISFSCQLIVDGAPRVSEGPPKLPVEAPSESNLEMKRVEQENERLAREVLNLRQQLKKSASSRGDESEEEEISQVKLNALQEINAMKDVESRRFDKWKRESIEEVERMVMTLIQQRQKSKLTREEISYDVAVALRAALLGEKVHTVPFQRPESHWKFLIAILVAGALCGGYVYRSKINARRPASVVYVPPPSKPVVVPPAAKPKVADGHAKGKKSKNK